jgi:hypothetical protein
MSDLDQLRELTTQFRPPPFDDLVAVSGRRRRRTAVSASGIAAAAVLVAIAGMTVLSDDRTDSQRPGDPTTQTPTEDESDIDTIPVEPPEDSLVRRIRGGLEVAGETVPGKWELTEARRDVWVAIKTDENGFTSQWWGKGATAQPMPASRGDILTGGVVISEDAHWIVWTRPAADVTSTNPPMVMEVVDTATGEVRWSRNADADVRDPGALAVTNAGVVVFAHCLEPVIDAEGYRQCSDARVDAWAPEADVVRTLPVGVRVTDPPFSDNFWHVAPLMRRIGAHNGLLIQSSETARPQYVRLSDRATVEVIATLPIEDPVDPTGHIKAVTADEHFALLAGRCDDGLFGCGWSVLALDGGERRPMPSLSKLVNPQSNYMYAFVVERDDLLLVREPGSGAIVARCSLSQARCVPIEK